MSSRLWNPPSNKRPFSNKPALERRFVNKLPPPLTLEDATPESYLIEDSDIEDVEV